MKILISDFDLSLYDKETDFHKTLTAIEEFRKSGNIFIIATGRNISSLLKTISPYGVFYDYIICGDGTKIFDQNLSELYSEYITHKNRRDIINALNSADCIDRVYIDDGYNFYDDNYDMDGTAIIASFDLSHRKETNDLLNDIVQKIPRCIRLLECQMGKHHQSKTQTKNTAIRKLVSLKGWNPNDVYTFGDEVNDYFMIKDYNGYMKENGNPVLKTCRNQDLSRYHRMHRRFAKKNHMHHAYDYFMPLESNSKKVFVSLNRYRLHSNRQYLLHLKCRMDV